MPEASPMEPLHCPSGASPAVAVLLEQFPQAVLGIEVFRGDTRVTVTRDSLVEVMTFLRDTPGLAYRFFSECMCVDYLDTKAGGCAMGRSTRFEVVYNLVSLRDLGDGSGPAHRLFVKTGVPDGDLDVPTVTSVYPGAEFPEREIFDMFGLRFVGHPDLRRLLMADDWVGHPQRKDYPLGGERVQFPSGTYGPSLAESVVQHPGESFSGRTASQNEGL